MDKVFVGFTFKWAIKPYNIGVDISPGLSNYRNVLLSMGQPLISKEHKSFTHLSVIDY